MAPRSLSLRIALQCCQRRRTFDVKKSYRNSFLIWKALVKCVWHVRHLNARSSGTTFIPHEEKLCVPKWVSLDSTPEKRKPIESTS